MKSFPVVLEFVDPKDVHFAYLVPAEPAQVPYPPDGGLGPQVRDVDECFSAYTLLREEFLKRRTERYKDTS